jgi:predicted ATP-binding protein involved in virulence
MRVREIVIRDFRNFRGERRISFVDPLTDQVRPVTVIAGTNGTGKTSILDAIEALLQFSVGERKPNEGIYKEALRSGYIHAVLEANADDLLQNQLQLTERFSVTFGRRDLVPDLVRSSNSNAEYVLFERKQPYAELHENEIALPVLTAWWRLIWTLAIERPLNHKVSLW